MPELTGGEIVGRTLSQYGVTHAAGIPGHGACARPIEDRRAASARGRRARARLLAAALGAPHVLTLAAPLADGTIHELRIKTKGS